MKEITRRIFYAGIHNDLLSFERRKIIALNKINALCLVLALCLVVVNLSYGLIYQGLANFGSLILVFLPVIYFNYVRKYRLARYTFTIGILLIGTFVSVYNYDAGRFVQNEVSLVGFSIIAVILYNGWEKRLLFMLFVLFTFLLEFEKYIVSGREISSDYYFTLINYSLAFVSIYFFSQLFRNQIEESLEETTNLNKALSESQKELQKTQVILKSLIDNSPVFLAMIDRDGRYLIANKRYEKAFRMSLDQIIGSSYKDVLPPDLVAFHQPLIEKSFGGGPIDFYEQVSLPNGEIFHAYGQYYPVYDDDGEVAYLTVYVTDVSDLKEAENKLRELNRTKDKLFSIIAHDLSSPINMLKNLLYLNEREEISATDTEEHIENIRENVSKLSHMLDNLLRWSQSQFYGVESKKEQTNLTSIIADNVELVKNLARSKNIMLVNHSSANLEVMADPNHIELILRNLINNALKFTPSGGKVEVFADETDDRDVQIRIRDNGVGISPERLEQLRKHELVLSEFGTDGEKGTGLGLSLCWGFASENQWPCEISSELGKGTEFRLSIPLISKEKVKVPDSSI